MKRPIRPARTPSKLSDSLHQRLNSYALAASAASVGMLALAQPAEGRIVYHQAHRVIGPNSKYNLDLNRDGITDFTLSARTFKTFVGNRGGNIGVVIPAGNAARGYVYCSTDEDNPYNCASALRARRKVQGGQRFVDKTLEMAWSLYTTVRGYGSGGPWRNVKNRYLGLKFVVDGQTHYGWARLNVNCKNHSECSGLLTGYAYETIPKKGIITGTINGPDMITLQPNAAPVSLGRLALGRK